MKMFQPRDPWCVQYCGGEYEIKYNLNRDYLQPKWYVKRLNDDQYSTRHYSTAAGAFLALSSGAVKWEKV